ncbi:unnamed protein product, partial [Urochloa humidicola]
CSLRVLQIPSCSSSASPPLSLSSPLTLASPLKRKAPKPKEKKNTTSRKEIIVSARGSHLEPSILSIPVREFLPPDRRRIFFPDFLSFFFWLGGGFIVIPGRGIGLGFVGMRVHGRCRTTRQQWRLRRGNRCPFPRRPPLRGSSGWWWATPSPRRRSRASCSPSCSHSPGRKVFILSQLMRLVLSLNKVHLTLFCTSLLARSGSKFWRIIVKSIRK